MAHGTRGGATWRHRRHPHRAVSHRREATSTEVRRPNLGTFNLIRTEPYTGQAKRGESVTHHASSQLSRTQTAHPIEFGIATETTRADVRAPDASTLRPPGCGWKPSMSIKPLQHHSRARARSLEMHPRAALFRLPAGAAQTTSASASASSATAAFDATYPAMPAFA